ncbi:DUF3048 domain-containing protein [Planctomonas psychrotolerans]|uniref:DUF3048 domain-containing protein n=1 Tax=Planctomonas psychrotolerans TaxID=2528712 RepID=UPI00123C4C73|nr:DUF3048 domain-containing protein [Planctomonas psychrotolerans]
MTRRSRRPIALCAAIPAAVALLTGCVGPSPGEPLPPSPTQTAIPLGYAPLRGTPVDSGSNDHPSLAAKIDNHPAARPQFGLEETDIVFEELVEGGLTRYVALWHSSIPETVGPVRSIRPMDPEILSPMGGIVAYSGGQPRFVEAMQDTPVFNAIHEHPDTADTFRRLAERSAPHNVVVDARDLVAKHDELDPPDPQFVYATDAASPSADDGAPASGVVTVFSPSSSASWAFDPAREAYLRSQNGVPDLDATGRQLGATNVVALQVRVDQSTDVPRTELLGTGSAWALTDGRVVEATWSKTHAEAPLRLTADSGASIRLAPGNTWVELVPAGTGAVRVVSG